MPDSWNPLPPEMLRGFRLEAVSWVGDAEVPRAARSLACGMPSSTDGVEGLNRQKRSLLTSTCIDPARNLVTMLHSLVVSEHGVDVDWHMNSGLPFFYGELLVHLSLHRIDGGHALQTGCRHFMEANCAGGHYPSILGDCYYHGVLQKYLKDYTGSGGAEDDGMGKLVLEWLGLILFRGTPADEEACFGELLAWISLPTRRNSHTDSLLQFARDAIGRRITLGTASIPRETPTHGNKASLTESDNRVSKKWMNGRPHKLLAKQASMQVAVANKREDDKASGGALAGDGCLPVSTTVHARQFSQLC